MIFMQRLGFALFFMGVCWSMLDLALGNSFARNYEGTAFWMGFAGIAIWIISYALSSKGSKK